MTDQQTLQAATVPTPTQIFALLKSNEREMFALLSDNNFFLAKALWGEGGCKGQTKHHHECSYVCQADWKHHLQQLSIAENRIEYLKQFVE